MSLRPHYQATLKVGWPIAVGQIGTIMVGFTDTLMVGHYNTPSLAAASFVNSVFNLFLFLTMGYSYGLTPLAGRLFGQRQYRRAGVLLKEAVCTNALYGILIIIGLLLVYSQVSHMGQDPKLLPLIRPYFLIMVGSMPFVILFNLLRQFTDAATDTAVAMWILLSSNVLNIVGNYLLINGIGPLPELGLNGAGLSTLLARAYTAVALTLFLLRSPRYRAALQGWQICRVSRSAIRNINRFSLPISLQMGMETGAFTLSGIMVGWLGAVQLAGYQVIITISTLGFLFFYSFGASTSIRISLFAGQDNWTEVRRASQAGRNILLVLCSATCVLFLTLGPWLVDSFTPYAVWGMPCCCRWCSTSWATPCKYATPTACAARRMCSRWPGLPASAIWASVFRWPTCWALHCPGANRVFSRASGWVSLRPPCFTSCSSAAS